MSRQTKAGLSRFFNAGDVMLLSVAAVWGGSYVVMKQLSRDGAWTSILSIRFLIGAALIAVFWLIRPQKITKKELWMGAVFGSSQVLVMSFETSGTSITSSTNAGLIISVSILLTPILESAWRRSWLPGKFFLATSLVMVGMVLLITGNGFVRPNIGDLLMVFAALFRTVHIVAVGRLSQVGQKVEVKPVSPVNLTMLQLATSGLIMFFYNPAQTVYTAFHYSSYDWWLMGFLAVFCTALGFIGLNWGIKHTSASRTSLLLGTEPVWATVLAVLVGGEVMGPVGAFGAALIVAATYWGQAIEQRYRLAKLADAANQLP